MLTNDGMLKVADLGLVKTPAADDDLEGTSPEDRNLMLASARANVTYQDSTMGTPAYMSPEQADDASTVDHREDIYSLGCTMPPQSLSSPDQTIEIVTPLSQPIAAKNQKIAGVSPLRTAHPIFTR